MRFWRIAVLILGTIVAVTGCGPPSDEELYYKAHKKIMSMESYETIAKIRAYTGKNQREYIFDQKFLYPDKYRLEVLSPESIGGNLTIFNGKTAWIQHAALGQTWKMDDFHHSKEQVMFIGYFLKNFLSSESSIYEGGELNGQKCIIIITELPGSNPYFYKQKLWIHARDFTPIKLDIIDDKERVIFEVFYENFKANPRLEEKIFYLDL